MDRKIVNGATVISTGDAVGGLKNKHGVTGVNYVKASKKYKAEITVKRKKYHLGQFDSLDDAKEIRMFAEQLVKDGTFIEWFAHKPKEKCGRKATK